MSAKVKVYTTQTCPYCHSAKALLKEKNVTFEEIDVTGNAEMREKLVQMSGGRTTVPQIFVDGKSIGGYQELAEYFASGKKI